MELNKQTQTAGDNATQIQAQNLIINNGITEERAREIFHELSADTYAKYSQEAETTINNRLTQFSNAVVSLLSKYDGALNAFADPAFQFLLKKAQLRAAITEREDDYALLSELLATHIQKGEDRKKRAAIRRAVDIVDEIDNDALCALTIATALRTLAPTASDCDEGLKAMEHLYERLPHQDLPEGYDWMEHLESLNAIKIIPLGHMPPLITECSKFFAGYVCTGIKPESKEYKKAIQILSDAHIPPVCFSQNGLLPDYLRLSISGNGSLEQIYMLMDQQYTTTEEEQSALQKILNLYVKDSKLQKQAEDNFIRLWDGFPTLKTIRVWWESISSTFYITPIGRILAYTNAKRYAPEIPDLT